MANVSRTDTCAVVVLTGGLSVLLPALQVAWGLEDKGCQLVMDDDDLVVRPRELLTEDDRRDIRQWLSDLKSLARYGAVERRVV